MLMLFVVFATNLLHLCARVGVAIKAATLVVVAVVVVCTSVADAKLDATEQSKKKKSLPHMRKLDNESNNKAQA